MGRGDAGRGVHEHVEIELACQLEYFVAQIHIADERVTESLDPSAVLANVVPRPALSLPCPIGAGVEELRPCQIGHSRDSVEHMWQERSIRV